MKLKFLFCLAFVVAICFSCVAQKNYEVISLTDSTYLLSDRADEDPEGIDSVQVIDELITLTQSKNNEYGQRLYRTYVADRERKAATTQLNKFTQDTSYQQYAKARFLPRLKGEWRVRGDSITSITINDRGRLIGLSPSRVVPYANSLFELKSWRGEDLIFFRDFQSTKRKFIAIRNDGSRMILIQK